jgi:hypothetical protein
MAARNMEKLMILPQCGIPAARGATYFPPQA